MGELTIQEQANGCPTFLIDCSCEKEKGDQRKNIKIYIVKKIKKKKKRLKKKKKKVILRTQTGLSRKKFPQGPNGLLMVKV